MCSIRGFHLGSSHPINDMPIGNDLPVVINEKAASQTDNLTIGIKAYYCNHGRLNFFDQVGEIFLCPSRISP